MYDPSDPSLAVSVGGKTISQHIQDALDRGDLKLTEDGYLTLGHAPAATSEEFGPESFVAHFGRPRSSEKLRIYPCTVLAHFFFDHAYEKSAIPYACRECYKIKVVTSTMRQMMVMKGIAESLPQSSKSGNELINEKTSGVYATYFYFRGLNEARQAYPGIRARIDADEKLGPSVKMSIKRGCSNFERAVGPSDQWTFDPAVEAAEAYLNSVYKEPEMYPAGKAIRNGLALLRWINSAYQIGDETYKDFTGGKPLYPPSVTYSPEE
jgi:hypothetical protein